jgi:uncharacterized membrane protein required for colicin V production
MPEGFTPPLASLLLGLPTGAWVDIGCALLALVSIGAGSRRGLSAELPPGVGWFCGVLVTWHVYAPLHAFLQELPFLEGEPEFLFFLCLMSAVLLAWLVAFLVARGLRVLSSHVEKTPADYALGTVAGVIRALLFLLILTTLLLGQPWWTRGREVFCAESWTGRLFTPWSTNLLCAIQKLNPHFEVRRRTDDPGDLTRGERPPNGRP